MSDTPRKDQVEQQNEQVEQSVEQIGDLPEKPIAEQSAEAVKGGVARLYDDEAPKESRIR